MAAGQVHVIADDINSFGEGRQIARGDERGRSLAGHVEGAQLVGKHIVRAAADHDVARYGRAVQSDVAGADLAQIRR